MSRSSLTSFISGSIRSIRANNSEKRRINIEESEIEGDDVVSLKVRTASVWEIILLCCCGCFCCIFIILVAFLFILLLLVPIWMIITGGYYYRDCPIRIEIPLWLIIAGFLSLLYMVFDFGNQKARDSLAIFRIVNILLVLLKYAWLIVGSIWIYTIQLDVQFVNVKSDNYCDKTLYLTAFIVCTIENIVAVLIFLICCYYGRNNPPRGEKEEIY